MVFLYCQFTVTILLHVQVAAHCQEAGNHAEQEADDKDQAADREEMAGVVRVEVDAEQISEPEPCEV